MGYIDDNLVPGERIVYRARLHRLAYAVPVIIALVGVALAVLVPVTGEEGLWLFAGVVFAAALVSWAITYVKHRSSEFGVTNKRVLMKTGLIRRRTVETMLSKIEGVDVEQTFVGRLIGSGVVTVTGTGGSREVYSNVAYPLELRRQVQIQLMQLDEARAARNDVPASAAPVAREERDCPWCAERILAKAKVCKHCGREVAEVQG